MALGNDVTLKVGFDIDKFSSELQKTNGILTSWGNSVTKIFATLGVAAWAKKTIGDVIEVTSQFQKFEAILTNTLGSNSQAKKALDEISDFAVRTPFEVAEITAAYVRWANMGLNPTIDRMNKLGDVASSLGAGFEQTAEAFKDLMVGQTKRIEEVGISATQMNGKIQLSFKGVNLEIEKNAEGVQKALDVFSQLNGVLGTSESISKTLGGQISNLSDAYTRLVKAVGDDTSSIIGNVVRTITEEFTLATLTLQKDWDEFMKSPKSPNQFTATTADLINAYNLWKKEVKNPADDAHNKLLKVRAQELINQYEGISNAIAQVSKLTNNPKDTWFGGMVTSGELLDELNSRLVGSNQAVAAGLAREAEAAQKAAAAYAELFHSKAGPSMGLKNGGGNLNLNVNSDLGSLPIEGLVNRPADMDKYIEENQKRIDAQKRQVEEMRQVQISVGAIVGDLLNTVIDAFAQSMKGTISFGAALLKGLAAFMKQFGQALVELGSAKLAADAIATNPWAAIAIGAALQLAAAAMTANMGAGMSSAMANGSSGGGGGRSYGVNSMQQEQRIVMVGEVKGKDIVFVYDSAKRDNYYQKGG